MSRSNRKEVQVTIAECIASIMTRLTPDGYGVELRFINETPSDLSNLNKAAVKERVGAITCGSNPTSIGTQLEKKILRPLVYDALKHDQFKRPLLISILTDGCPGGEDPDKLQQVIYECGNRLEAAGHPRRGALSFPKNHIPMLKTGSCTFPIQSDWT